MIRINHPFHGSVNVDEEFINKLALHHGVAIDWDDYLGGGSFGRVWSANEGGKPVAFKLSTDDYEGPTIAAILDTGKRWPAITHHYWVREIPEQYWYEGDPDVHLYVTVMDLVITEIDSFAAGDVARSARMSSLILTQYRNSALNFVLRNMTRQKTVARKWARKLKTFPQYWPVFDSIDKLFDYDIVIGDTHLGNFGFFEPEENVIWPDLPDNFPRRFMNPYPYGMEEYGLDPAVELARANRIREIQLQLDRAQDPEIAARLRELEEMGMLAEHLPPGQISMGVTKAIEPAKRHYLDYKKKPKKRTRFKKTKLLSPAKLTLLERQKHSRVLHSHSGAAPQRAWPALEFFDIGYSAFPPNTKVAEVEASLANPYWKYWRSRVPLI